MNEKVYPLTDIYETEKTLMIICDVPGVSEDGITASVEDNILTIEGKSIDRAHDERKKLIQEFSLQDYYRQFKLGDGIDLENITADLNQGVLTVKLGKSEQLQPRKIEINIA